MARRERQALVAPIAARRGLLKAAALLAGSLGASMPSPSDAVKPDRRRPQRQYRTYVDGPYGQIHVTVTEPVAGKATRPAVICLPMSPRSGRDFDEFALTLADSRVVYAPDLPGFGGSDTPPSPPRIEDFASALLAVIPQLETRFGKARPIDCVGQHTGAAVSIEMARQAPGRIRRMALIGIPHFTDEQRIQLRSAFVKPRPYFTDADFLSATWKRDLPAIAAGQPPERMLLRFTEIMRAGTHSHWGFNAVFNYDLHAALPALGMPVLAILLKELLTDASREVARSLPQGEVADLTELPGSAIDFAAARLAQVAAEFFDRA